MRNIRVWSVVAVSLVAVLLSDGARAQRVRPEAVTRTPSQVEVTNFPVIQTVGGTVNVGNLPAVQNVTGSIAVSNLPLDTDGNLKVSCLAPAKRSLFVKIADGVVFEQREQVLATYHTDGWNQVTVYVRLTALADAPIFGTTDTSALSSVPYFGGAGAFSYNSTLRGVGSNGWRKRGDVSVSSQTGDVVGPEMQILMFPDNNTVAGSASMETWLYLTD